MPIMQIFMYSFILFCTVSVAASVAAVEASGSQGTWKTLIGDPGMTAEYPATAWCGWNFCNGAKAPEEYDRLNFSSPRLADCQISSKGKNAVSVEDNLLRAGESIPGENETKDVEVFAREKELFLGRLCARPFATDKKIKFSHWSVMFKSGNMDLSKGLCPETLGEKDKKSHLGFNNLPMNQPLMVHRWTKQSNGWSGGFFAGTYDVNVSWTSDQLEEVQSALLAYTDISVQQRVRERWSSHDKARTIPDPPEILANSSILFTAWYRNCSNLSHIERCNWVYFSGLKPSKNYPWLMNYLRSNDISGGYGGYPWNGSGMMDGPVSATREKGLHLVVNLNVLNNGVGHNQFYLPEISGCWKLNGEPCDGDLMTDVTRYICFGMDPKENNGCTAENQNVCPPSHMKIDGTLVYRNDTKKFPYECYSGWCPPPNLPGTSFSCDPYSNPAPQELVQILPCDEWGVHGFPTKKGQGWVGDGRTWDLDVGALGARVYFSGQNPDEKQGGYSRQWISFEVGPEMTYQPTVDKKIPMQWWEVSKWDVLQQT